MLEEGDVMTEYEMYDKLQNHLQFSKELHYINTTGKYILSQLEINKNIKKNRIHYVFDGNMESLYNTIVDITNIKRFNKLRLYFCLQYYLDELLFSEVKTLNSFQVEDYEYPLCDVYFNQNGWCPLSNEDIIQSEESCNFKPNPSTLETDEMKYIKYFFWRYNKYIQTLIEYLAGKTDNKYQYVKTKLKRILNRIQLKITNADVILLKL